MMSTTEGELDVEVSQELEEGELENSDVEEGTYIPLSRPDSFDPPSLVKMHIQDEQSEEESAPESSASDSDDEPRKATKRPKLRIRKQQQKQSAKKDKYNIWSKPLQEELLTEELVGMCDVTKKKLRYGVESYDYTLKYRLDDEIVPKTLFTNNDDNMTSRQSNKRRFEDRSNLKLRLGKRVNSHHKEIKPVPRYLADLSVTTDDDTETIAGDIALKLSEEKLELLGKIVEVLGANKAIEIYKQTQSIEADGGMLVMNGTRRRTPGGIFFFLLKRDEDVSQQKINDLFKEDQKETVRRIKRIRTKSRQKVVEQLKQSLTDSEIPSLQSRGEATIQTEHGSNPPPSPATDARECSSDTDSHSHTEAAPPSPPRPRSPLPNRTERSLQNYEDDDFIEITCNDMDLF